MKPVIEVTDISKSYQISHQAKASYNTIKDDFEKLIRKPFGGGSADKIETFWALKDINFQVNQGEVFGIVGKNGSGKSTLLKILSRIVDPTSGTIKIHGKVASLLEVGTGFHPELTGRENIYFNGSMIGMSKREITKKFNEIVDFSEVEQFLDTPVKFYSSGMYVRLAFSVAAHLESEILIIDEVLSVGDAQFQKKSLAKMTSIAKEGRTILFVSHSMASVQELCSKALLLEKGKIKIIGDTESVTSKYLERNLLVQESINNCWTGDKMQEKNGYFTPHKFYVTDEDGNMISQATPNNKPKFVTIEATVDKESDLLKIGYIICNETKTTLYSTYPTDSKKEDWPKMKKGRITMRAAIPAHLLNEGKYTISLVGGLDKKAWFYEPGTRVPSIEYVIGGGLSESPLWSYARDGLLAPVIKWEVLRTG